MFDVEEGFVEHAVVLIIDSEEINRRLLKAIFKTTPYKILESRKATEAMALVKKTDQKLAGSGWQRITRITDSTSTISVRIRQKRRGRLVAKVRPIVRIVRTTRRPQAGTA